MNGINKMNSIKHFAIALGAGLKDHPENLGSCLRIIMTELCLVVRSLEYKL